MTLPELRTKKDKSSLSLPTADFERQALFSALQRRYDQKQNRVGRQQWIIPAGRISFKTLFERRTSHYHRKKLNSPHLLMKRLSKHPRVMESEPPPPSPTKSRLRTDHVFFSLYVWYKQLFWLLEKNHDKLEEIRTGIENLCTRTTWLSSKV